MTAGKFDCIVIGRGLMGSAAARHLALSGAEIALIGPVEPVDKTVHTGVFGSHYDEGRITRSLDGDHDWSLLSSRSIGRYRNIEAASGIRFFSETGAMIAGPEGACMRTLQSIKAKHRITAETLRNDALAHRFPYFEFEPGTLGLYEPDGAGHISPRNLVRAQSAAAEKAGATLIDETVVRCRRRDDHMEVITDKGDTYRADKVLLAAGYNSRLSDLAKGAPPLNVYARTIVFFEVDKAEADRLSGMPSLIFVPKDRSCDPYLLPPIRYPDGKLYLKIGGDPKDVALRTSDEVRAWFQGSGNPSVRDCLENVLFDLMPGLTVQSITSGACVTSFTATGKPIIQALDDRTMVVTGGNGRGAKCSDELGRLASALLLGQRIDAESYDTDFRAAL